MKEIVDDVADDKTQISEAEARNVNPEAALGETVLIESTPRDFGRIAAQTAKQVILQRIREAERDALYSSFADSAGEIALGTIQSVDYHSGDVIVNLEGAEALLPSREQVPSERYRRGTRLRAYVVDVRRGNRGPQITLSRRSPALLRRLLELEVPEIFNGAVEIKGIAREAGSRSKVAVHATQDGVDPVGSCVGVRGGRIQNVVNELGGEKIDVVQWNVELSGFIANSLSPAKVMNVLLDDNQDTGKTATVIVPDRQLSLAIGKEGQNARLAAKLTGWRIDIKSATEAAEETLGRLEDIEIAREDMDLLTLAESLLRDRQEAEFNEEQQELIAKGVEEGVEAGVSWPEEEPVPASEEAEAPAAVAELDAAEAGGEPVEPLAAVAEEEEVGVEMATADPEAAAPDLVDKPSWDETVPTFEGEPVEDSLGWVPIETPDEYYTGWSEPEEEEEEKVEWVREEIDESRLPKTKEKKGRKRRGRRAFEDDPDLEDWSW